MGDLGGGSGQSYQVTHFKHPSKRMQNLPSELVAGAWKQGKESFGDAPGMNSIDRRINLLRSSFSFEFRFSPYHISGVGNFRQL
jgi:hypothetical protein